eukprot:2368736-Heterocapsa_arctica.AAC.1
MSSTNPTPLQSHTKKVANNIWGQGGMAASRGPPLSRAFTSARAFRRCSTTSEWPSETALMRAFGWPCAVGGVHGLRDGG